MLETKTISIALKMLDANMFSGYFATFNVVDRGLDIIRPGAFHRDGEGGLDDFVQTGAVNCGHDMTTLGVAYPLSAETDTKGLLVTGRFLDSPNGQEARQAITSRLRAGRTCQGSIGYKVRSGGSRQISLNGKSVRELLALDLYECSFVSVAMNPSATILAAKSLDAVGLTHRLARMQDQGRHIQAAYAEAITADAYCDVLANDLRHRRFARL